MQGKKRQTRDLEFLPSPQSIKKDQERNQPCAVSQTGATMKPEQQPWEKISSQNLYLFNSPHLLLLTLSVEITLDFPLFSHLKLLGTMRELNIILKAVKHFLIKKNANLCVQHLPIFQEISYILASKHDTGCKCMIRCHYVQVHFNFIIGEHAVSYFKGRVLGSVGNMHSGCV